MSDANWPVWANELARRYYTKTISTFVLHGAVRDLQPASDKGARSFVPLKTFLADELFASREVVIFYDRSKGIHGATPATQRDLLRIVEAYDAMYGTTFSANGLPKDPQRALPVVEAIVRSRLSEGKRVAVVIDFAETIAPAGDATSLSADDRFSMVTLVRWAQDTLFLERDFTLVLIAESLSELSPRLSRHAHAALLTLELPTAAERAELVRARLGASPFEKVASISLDAFVSLTSGLSRIQLSRLMSEAMSGNTLDADDVKARKKEILQAECHGLLEFIEPRHTLDVVSGHSGAKALLRGAASAIRAGRTDVVPMGFLVAGPIGTGKTFLTTCFAGEIGIPCVKFLNFRSQWQGVTEANLERIFQILRAMNPVAVIIDEADAMLGNRDASGDSGTSARVFGSIAAFMGNTEYRGKIVWFLLTARPDLLPVDLKRQGRAEEHLALFYPENNVEKAELFRAMARKTGTDLGTFDLDSLMPPDLVLSGADIEAALVRARGRAVAQGREQVTAEDLRATLADFLPPSYPLEVELQTLCAVVECTSRELLPEKYRHADRSELVRRIRELKLMLAEV